MLYTSKTSVLITVLFILATWMPLNVHAGQDISAIKDKPSVKKLYERAVEFFTVKMPEAFEKQLGNSSQYMELITDIFAEKEIPLDIAYLPLVESGFSHMSVGRGGVVGLWQFAKQTGRKYGLTIDKYVDERKDPIKSTRAAASYLKDLYERFGAWDIALAAYNAGEGRIQKVVRKTGTERLPTVFNKYLAKLMAVSTVAQDPERYGIELRGDFIKHPDFIEIATDKVISLASLAETYDTTVEAIKALNPALLRNETPPYLYILRLPMP